MNFIADLDRGAIRHQHPHGNLQPFSASIDDRDCAISPLGPPDDLKSRTMKRMERIENPDLVAFREQGIVGADVFIPTFITSFPPAILLPMVPDGSTRRPDSSCPFKHSARSSAASSVRNYGSFSNRTDSSSITRFSTLPHLEHSTISSGNWAKRTGSYMPSHPSAVPNTF